MLTARVSSYHTNFFFAPLQPAPLHATIQEGEKAAETYHTRNGYRGSGIRNGYDLGILAKAGRSTVPRDLVRQRRAPGHQDARPRRTITQAVEPLPILFVSAFMARGVGAPLGVRRFSRSQPPSGACSAPRTLLYGVRVANGLERENDALGAFWRVLCSKAQIPAR